MIAIREHDNPEQKPSGKDKRGDFDANDILAQKRLPDSISAFDSKEVLNPATIRHPPTIRLCHSQMFGYPSSMSQRFSAAAHWDRDFDEAGLQKWAEKLRASLGTPKVSLGLVFMAPRFFDKAREVLEILRVHGQASVLAGCSSQWL